MIAYDTQRRIGIFGQGSSTRLWLAFYLLLAGCAEPAPSIAPNLSPAPGALTWPQPPDTPRYALAGILIGKQDFIAPEDRQPAGFDKTLRWIAGLVIGPRRYPELQRPVAGLTRADGTVLVVDASNKAVFVFDMSGKRFDRWIDAAQGIGFESPIAIAEDSRGGYLITDSKLGEVFRLDSFGKPAGRFGRGIVTRPTGVAVDPEAERIYVADTAKHDIKVFSLDGDLIDTLGSPGKEPGRFNAPTHLVFANNSLYVADTLNFRVQVFDRAGDGQLAFGRLGLFVGDLTRPKGVAVGEGGRIYVVESYYDHLLVFEPRGELLMAIGGTGNNIGSFYLPSGVWTDAQGRVYVADMFNGRVVVLQELTSVAGG